MSIQFYMVTYDKLLDRSIENLTDRECEALTAYNIQKKVAKDITPRISNRINEWELPWNNYHFQQHQFYEYGTYVHLYNNQHIIQQHSHIGILHYDVRFNTNSINRIYSTIEKQPDTIFYQSIRPANQLSLSKFESDQLCRHMSHRMNDLVTSDTAWNKGWISESLVLLPKNIFLQFGKYLNDYHADIEYILKNNIWNIMNHCPHRVCGIVERLLGFYLVSRAANFEQLDIIHDWSNYEHQHMKMNGTGVATI